MTKKNRKVRRLRELHPDVEVKILYQRDYLNLLMKFGLADPVTLSEIDGPGEPPSVGLEGATAGLEGNG